VEDWQRRIRDWYDRDPEFEWRRLEWRVQNRLEHLVALHAIARHLPPPSPAVRVLDAGGGPGRYTIALARQGYRMTLLDLSPGNLAFARRKIAEAGPEVTARVEGVVEGSFTDLSAFPDAGFDAVLCLGAALSHVVDADARRQALAELRRVARPGAPLIVAVFNRLGLLRGALMWGEVWDQEFSEEKFRRLVATGLDEGGDWWPSYWFMPEEFVALLEAGGLEVLRLYGAQGIAAHMPPDNLGALMADPKRWPAWRELLLATCDHPNVVGVSLQLIAAARRADDRRPCAGLRVTGRG
jgi:SAM-dependent methyltransferase